MTCCGLAVVGYKLKPIPDECHDLAAYTRWKSTYFNETDLVCIHSDFDYNEDYNSPNHHDIFVGYSLINTTDGDLKVGLVMDIFMKHYRNSELNNTCKSLGFEMTPIVRVFGYQS